MKLNILFALFSVLALATTRGYTQTRVTGHVSAEIVESVSASQQSQSSFSFQRNQSERIDFGQIEIKSAASASCSLILGKVNLTGNNLQHYSMETSASSTRMMQGNAINGTQNISLQCQPDSSIPEQDASQYQGEVNIVLAYN